MGTARKSSDNSTRDVQVRKCARYKNKKPSPSQLSHHAFPLFFVALCSTPSSASTCALPASLALPELPPTSPPLLAMLPAQELLGLPPTFSSIPPALPLAILVGLLGVSFEDGLRECEARGVEYLTAGDAAGGARQSETRASLPLLMSASNRSATARISSSSEPSSNPSSDTSRGWNCGSGCERSRWLEKGS